MGEQIAARESICKNQADGTYLGIDGNLRINYIVCLHSFTANKLIYVHNAAFGYNKCKFNSILEAALMIKRKGISGDISNDC
jgi:hypothetical protein